MNYPSIKSQLHALCLNWANERIDSIQKEIGLAQSSANEETKSSAGDKYETSRAMLQLDIEKNTVQLAEANKLKSVLVKIQLDKTTDTIQLGSLVITTQGNFYISVSAGFLIVDQEKYTAISPASPIGSLLQGHRSGDEVIFNKKVFKVILVS